MHLLNDFQCEDVSSSISVPALFRQIDYADGIIAFGGSIGIDAILAYDELWKECDDSPCGRFSPG
jgi:hypothetical protein